MVKQPVVGTIGEMLWNFSSTAQGYMHSFPQLWGRRFGELPFYFPGASLLGILDPSTGSCSLAPLPDVRLQPGELLLLMRDSEIAFPEFQPLSDPVKVDAGMQSEISVFP